MIFPPRQPKLLPLKLPKKSSEHKSTARPLQKMNKMLSTIQPKKVQAVHSSTLLESHLFIIRVVVKSNYGNPSEISCSEIDALDARHCPLPVVDLKFVPSVEHLTSPKLLVNSELIKEGPEWTAVWPQTDISIILSVAASKPPSYLRIWNSKAKNNNNIKEVVVTVGETFVNSAVVPKNFGIILSLAAMTTQNIQKELAMMYQASNEEAAIDKYGEIPIKPTKEISIQIIDTCDESEYFGIGGVECITVTGNRIDANSIRINVKCGELLSSPKRILQKFSDGSLCNSFIAKKGGDPHPIITLKFSYPPILGMIRITNIRPQTFDEDFSIRRIIVVQNRLFRVQKLMSNKFRNYVDIWLTDSLPIRQKAKAAFDEIKMQ